MNGTSKLLIVSEFVEYYLERIANSVQHRHDICVGTTFVLFSRLSNNSMISIYCL